MFTKYLGKFQKAEAEWAMQVIDLSDGDVAKARASIMDALQRLTKHQPPIDELKSFDDAVAASFFANRDWWAVGLKRLSELGKIAIPSDGAL